MPPKSAQDAQGLSPLEKQVHGAALAAPNKTLTGDELSRRFAQVPIEEQLLAINGLLKKNLFNAQKGPDGIQYVAVSKGEASLLGSMDSNELIIYNHIKDARNEGIWTKLIKARTNLHQTIMTRCLRTLEQKQLVKSVKSVKFPTRKIYMLYDLTPSIELSGGPWYTDNELDTGFIHELSMACLRFIQSKSWPKDGRSSALFPASHTHLFPSVHTVHRYLKQARLTDTELEPEHVAALLELLIYDQQIEKIPVLPVQASLTKRRASPSSSSSSDDDSEHSSGSDTPSRKRKHRRRKSKASDDESGNDESDDHDKESDEDVKPKRRSSRKVRIQASESTESSEDDDDSPTAKSRARRRSKSASRHRRHEDVSTDSESDQQENRRRHRRRRDRERKRRNDRNRDEESAHEPEEEDQIDTSATQVPYVYRAVKPLLEPHSSMICTTFVAPNSTQSSVCDQCNTLDFDEGVIFADPFAAADGQAEEPNIKDSGIADDNSQAPQLGWLESNLS